MERIYIGLGSNLAAPAEQLRHALVHKLVYTFVELLALHRVVILYILEHFRRETRQSFEVKWA